ncbi:hypothetical protein ACS0TY_015863 [Phlomoides rotata]
MTNSFESRNDHPMNDIQTMDTSVPVKNSNPSGNPNQTFTAGTPANLNTKSFVFTVVTLANPNPNPGFTAGTSANPFVSATSGMPFGALTYQSDSPMRPVMVHSEKPEKFSGGNFMR